MSTTTFPPGFLQFTREHENKETREWGLTQETSKGAWEACEDPQLMLEAVRMLLGDPLSELLVKRVIWDCTIVFVQHAETLRIARVIMKHANIYITTQKIKSLNYSLNAEKRINRIVMPLFGAKRAAREVAAVSSFSSSENNALHALVACSLQNGEINREQWKNTSKLLARQIRESLQSRGTSQGPVS